MARLVQRSRAAMSLTAAPKVVSPSRRPLSPPPGAERGRAEATSAERGSTAPAPGPAFEDLEIQWRASIERATD